MFELASQYRAIREQSEVICKPLATEDYVIQTSLDVSPTKWHLAHVTWFFETFLLKQYLPDYTVYNPIYSYLFNSYYESLGSFHPHAARGLLSRPTVQEVYQYRHYVDDNMQKLIQSADNKILAEIKFPLQLGLHHEQQHQELMLMDIKYNFAQNPLRPAYCEAEQIQIAPLTLSPIIWTEHPGGLSKLGYDGEGFAYDNERPQHIVYIAPFKISNRLVTNAEYLQFIQEGGYQKPRYWLSDGWQCVLKENWQAPLYWEKRGDAWWTMTLFGMREVFPLQPVCHVSYYEADAFARWANARLPTEAEWEVSAALCTQPGNFFESGYLHPTPAPSENITQFFGDVWEWTQSAYSPYPGFVPFANAFSEYNGKFACNQFVLRGGSVVTPENNFRPTYRNFFYPHQRWPFTGIRLAKN